MCEDGDSPANDCNRLSSQTKQKIRECSNVPEHGKGAAKKPCYAKHASTKNQQEDLHLMMSCYGNMTGIIKDGVINKNAVKRLYRQNRHSHETWMPVIGEGIKCEYDSSLSLAEKVIKFYNC